MALVTYFVERMRIVKPSVKVAEANPERALTVHGNFRQSKEANGKVVAGEPLTFHSKVIDWEDTKVEGFAIDMASGTLTIPSGEKGRKEAVSLTAEQLIAYLSGEAESDAEGESEDEPDAQDAGEGESGDSPDSPATE